MKVVPGQNVCVFVFRNDLVIGLGFELLYPNKNLSRLMFDKKSTNMPFSTFLMTFNI